MKLGRRDMQDILKQKKNKGTKATYIVNDVSKSNRTRKNISKIKFGNTTAHVMAEPFTTCTTLIFRALSVKYTDRFPKSRRQCTVE